MPSNIEIKARVVDPDQLQAAVEILSDIPVERIQQEDTFFNIPKGRLKLRDFGDGSGELIHYQRADIAGPKTSQYKIVPTNDPIALKSILKSVLGPIGIVRKERRFYRVGQTRIHLDQVEGLGLFVELEVVLRPEQSIIEGIHIAEELMNRLGIDKTELIEMAYIDLLAEARPGHG